MHSWDSETALLFLYLLLYFPHRENKEPGFQKHDSSLAIMATDQTALMKEILTALQTLQMNQVQLASNVDAISGRVNVLAGMKEVASLSDTATTEGEEKSKVTKHGNGVASEESLVLEESKVPESPTLTAAQVDGGAGLTARVQSSRIILTCVGLFSLASGRWMVGGEKALSGMGNVGIVD